jgi:hypothetical protein
MKKGILFDSTLIVFIVLKNYYNNILNFLKIKDDLRIKSSS